MKLSVFISAFTCFLLITSTSNSQSMDFLDFTKIKPYRISAAVALNGQVLSKEFFVKDKPKIGFGMPGVLTVATVSVSKKGSTTIDDIKFHVAIKNKRTNTTWIYTKDAVSKLDLDELLKKCEPGDRLIFMPTDQQYSLSLHEMTVMDGC